MPKPREQQISLCDTRYYHVCSRVVRQAFLCGIDESNGKNYEHRRDWVARRIHQLASVFAIDICAYAVMHNHLHLVLYVDVEQIQKWSEIEVLRRWHELFKGTHLTKLFTNQATLSSSEVSTVKSCIEVYRQRLMDISWFMRALNEYIARKANAEDECTGRFWEGRFKSQALLDEAALLTCMVYVDLNPVRAKIATTPEQSDFTSIQLRIKAALKGEQPAVLAEFRGNERNDNSKGIHFELIDYFSLVDTTGRIMREDKPGVIDPLSLPLLSRINVSPTNWLKIATEFEHVFTCAVGAPQSLSEYYQSIGLSRRHGIANSQRWLSSG
ncbi:transposase [Thalassotalea fusca]